jgi:hypothetical protein
MDEEVEGIAVTVGDKSVNLRLLREGRLRPLLTKRALETDFGFPFSGGFVLGRLRIGDVPTETWVIGTVYWGDGTIQEFRLDGVYWNTSFEKGPLRIGFQIDVNQGFLQWMLCTWVPNSWQCTEWMTFAKW